MVESTGSTLQLNDIRTTPIFTVSAIDSPTFRPIWREATQSERFRSPCVSCPLSRANIIFTFAGKLEV